MNCILHTQNSKSHPHLPRGRHNRFATALGHEQWPILRKHWPLNTEQLPPETQAEYDKLDIQSAMSRYPRLTINGMKGANDPWFNEQRESLLEEHRQVQFRLAYTFLRGCLKRKTINDGPDSYSLKHYVEDWARSFRPDLIPYVSNGLFIAAAYNAGFQIRTYPAFPSVHINICNKSLKSQMKNDGSSI
jgi:hypothetical protein